MVSTQYHVIFTIFGTKIINNNENYNRRGELEWTRTHTDVIIPIFQSCIFKQKLFDSFIKQSNN